MNLNSQYSFYPSQPDNPSDLVRHSLALHALTQKGWAEDINIIRELMSPPPDITNYAKPGEFKGLKVAVMGGGLAGLAAAYELRKLGFEITILDALEDRVGGRVYTYFSMLRKPFITNSVQ
jgi:monoamine oxidase